MDDPEAIEQKYPPGTMRLLHEAFQALRKSEQEYLTQRGYEGVTLTHARVLQHVVYTGGSLSDIARRSDISRQAVARASADLEQMGFVLRSTSGRDRRTSEVALTPEGRELFRVLRRSIAASERSLGQRLGPRRLVSLRAMLAELVGR